MASVVAVVALTTQATGAGTAAAADPTPADAVRAAISGPHGLVDFVDGLAGVGVFGQQVTGLTLQPGSAGGLAFADLLGGAVDAVGGYVGAATIGDLAAAINGTDQDYSADLAPKRHVKWSAAAATNGSVTSLDVTAVVTRTVPTGIRVATQTKPFDFTSAKGLTATLTFTGHLKVDYDATAKTAWVEPDPSLRVDIDSSIDKLTDVDAAIGILGVTLADKSPSEKSSYDEHAHLAVTVRDPNNDGRLSVGTNGELGAAGAPAGLSTAGFASPGGTLAGTLHIVPRPSTVITDLPGATVDVTLSAADLATGAPTADYADHALDPVAAFETLTPFDLAQGVGQLATTLTELQHARPSGSTVDVDLPVLHGTVADLVPAGEALSQFLADHVVPAANPDSPSQPDFASVQQFLDELAATKGPAGASIYHVTISGASFDDSDPAHPKLVFTIGVHRDPSGQPADPLADLLSDSGATVTYADTTITDTAKDWTALGNDPATKAIVAGLPGRKVLAGTSSAVIKSVSGHVITLDPAPFGSPAPSSLWNGGTPGNGADKPAYTISAGNSKIGNVELGNALHAKGHLRDANAVRSQATITPGYDLTLPMVLDLEPAVTGTDCQTKFGSAQPCPYTATTGKDGKGPQLVVTELPLRADRFGLTTGGTLLSATSVLTTAVDLVSPVGYVPVHVGGSLTLCPKTGYDATCAPSGGTPSLLSLTLKTPPGAPSPAVPIGTLFDTARDHPDDVIGGSTAPIGHLHGALTFDVVGDPTYFQPDGTPGTSTIDADLPAAGDPVVADGDLPRLAVLDVSPGHDDALFGMLLADVTALSNQLQSPASSNGLDTTIPLVGTSFGQLMADGDHGAGAGVSYALSGGFLALTDSGRTFSDAGYQGRRILIGSSQYAVARTDPNDSHTLRLTPPPAAKPADGTAYRVGDELLWSADAFTAAPPVDLGALLADFKRRLGNGSDVSFTVDTAASPPVLHLSIDWKRTFASRAPVALHVSLPASGQVDLAGSTAGGVVDISVTGETIAKLNLPLDAAAVADPAAKLTIDPSSSRSARAQVSTPGKALAGSVGSLQIDLGDAGGDPGMQLKADLAASATDSTDPAGTGVALGTWAGNLAAGTLNAGTAAQTCTGVSSTEPMSLCAKIPLHPHGSGADLGTLTVRLPQTASDIPGALGLTPDFGGGPRLGDLGPLDAAIQANTIGFQALADGLSKYLDSARSGLNLASAGGRVPLIGKDLQAGQDFLGNLQTGLSDKVGGVSGFATFGDIRTKLKAIFAADPLKSLVRGTPTVDGHCSVPVAAPSGVDFAVTTGSGATADTNYKYAVVAKGPDGQFTALSAPAADRQNAATLDADSFNTVSWTGSLHAAEYQVFRQRADDGVWHLVGSATGTTLKDTGQGSGAAPPAAGSPRYDGPCDPGDPADGVTSVTLDASFGQGKIDAVNGCQDDGTDKCLSAKLPLDLGLPGISLHATRDPADGSVDTGITAKLGWNLNLSVTLDKSKGVLLETDKGAQPEFLVGAAIHLPDIEASLAFVKVSLTNADAADSNQLAALFSIDLGCPGCDAAKQLPLSKLIGADPASLFTPNIRAKVAIDEKVDTGIDPSLPGLAATFKFHGDWNGKDPTNFTIAALEFDDVTVTPGTFLTSAIKPIIDDIVSTLKPVQPILDTITAPIPVLSDLSHLAGGDDVTIVTLAQAFGFGDGTVSDVLDVIKKVTQLATALGSLGSAGGFSLGSFKLVSEKVKDTASSPAVADSLVEPGAQPASIVDDLNGDITSATDKLSDAESGLGVTFPALLHPRQLFTLIAGGDATLAQFDSGELSVGFEMSESFGPVYAPPPVNIVISGGASVSLHVVAGFDTYGIRRAVETGKLDTSILNSLFFVTVDGNGAPLPVITFDGFLAAGAEVSAVIIKVGVQGGIELTVNFTWNDPTNDGKFRFEEFLAAALRNPICLFNVGGELSLFVKVYVELGISPFSVSFDFTLVDITLLDFSISPNCDPPPPRLGGKTAGGVLYLFAGNLGDLNNGAHPRGDPFWDAAGEDETWVVRQSGSTMTVQALGITQTFTGINTVALDGRGYAGKLKVLFQGKDKDAPFSARAVVFGGTSDDVIKTGTGPASIDGGNGADVVTAGDRPDVSAATDDTRKAVVAGDGGADHISVGNEKDTVAGDGHLHYATASVQTTAFGDGTDPDKPVTVTVTALDLADVGLDETETTADGPAGNDVVAVGLGGGTAYGGGGDDQISVAADSPLADTSHPGIPRSRYVDPGTTIVGGTGSDSISGGTGPDVIYTGNDPGAPVDQDVTGTSDPQSSRGQNTVDTGTGSDAVIGSDAPDFVVGHSKPNEVDTLYGLGGTDVLVGGDGKDMIYGGRGGDYVIAEPSEVDVNANLTDQIGSGAYRVTPLPDANPALDKTLVGGGGKDRIYGGDGNSTIYGDHDTFTDVSGTHVDACTSPGPDRSDPPAEHPKDAGNEADDANRDAADLILGGNGVDTVQAGGGGDWVFTYRGDDKTCAEGGADHVYAGIDRDTVFGGSGGDVLQGDSEPDNLYGNGGDDTVYGNAGTDTVEGNAGADTLFGGEDADTIIGGTTTAGRNDAAATPAGEAGPRGDIIRGDTGADTIIGDNGDPASAAGPVFDLGSGSASLGGPDTIDGGDDVDHAYGGLAADTIRGGGANDYLEGNPGADTISGEAGADDVIGGSHQTPGNPAAKDAAGYPDDGDTISGGDQDDVIAGDNAAITDTATPDGGDPVTRGRGLSVGRTVVLFDLGYSPNAANAGGDIIGGDGANDVIYGQAGIDTVHGNAGDDYAEGDQDADVLFGDTGQDDLAGGSSYAESGTGQATAGQLDTGDTISGGDGADVVLGDNGLLARDPALPVSPITQGRSDTDATPAVLMFYRSIQPYDLGDSPAANTSGGDEVTGDNGCDAVLGQGGNDRLKGNADADYTEGGPGRDWVEGNTGDDDLVGGSSTIFGNDTGNTTQGQPDAGDAVFGGAGDDVVLGDNAVTNRVGTPSPYLLRVGSSGAFDTQRSLRLLDLSWSSGFLGAPTRPVAGGDQLSGGTGVDVIFGQDGDDAVSGGAGEDYAEGNGGHDTMYGDRTLSEAGIAIAPPVPAWPGSASADLGDLSAPNGQDDLIGGSSLQAFRDIADDVHGDGAADFILGDNGTAVRDIVDQTGKPVALGDDLSTLALPLTNRIYAKRYDPAHVPAGAAFVRHGVAGAPTRFCTTAQATCEPTGGSGGDNLWGDAGEDTLYGQDGDDVMYGDTGISTAAGDGADDMYGELGNDRMWGDGGEDAMVGDRGGIVDVFQNGSNHFVIDDSQVPQIHYDGFLAGSVTRQADLLHDVNGDAFAGTGAGGPMPHRGDLEGGDDRIRGGDGHDSIHGGFGDDLANGDSGGDIVFGDDGADLLWGGKGCDASVDTAAAAPDCYPGGTFDLSARGDNDRMVDYLNGGKGATSGPSVAPGTGDLGSDIIDWHPRGTYGTPGPTTCTANPWPQTFGNGNNATTIDPCAWFEMTNLDNATVADNQHHQGIDWMYGGWDRDVLQADVADNGPNLGDRLLDWNGAYNLYTHCNAAYGGFNDVRQFSPTMQSFLQQWAYSLGAGQVSGDVTTSGTSAFDELALVYQADISAHGTGSAFPSTPGHFDDPNACAP